jgi:hypothetical protein
MQASERGRRLGLSMKRHPDLGQQEPAALLLDHVAVDVQYDAVVEVRCHIHAFQAMGGVESGSLERLCCRVSIAVRPLLPAATSANINYGAPQ